MKLIVKQHISGAKGVVEIGEVIDVDDLTALRYIKKNIAEPKTKKELDSFLSKIKKLQEEKKEKDAKVKALLEKDRIETELNSLYLDVINKEAELEGVVLSETETVDLVEDLKKRIAKAK